MLIIHHFICKLYGCLCTKNSKRAKNSVWAHDNIKIDGKADEWNNNFQAYNKTTGYFYTIANNEDYLFLIIQAGDNTIIQKATNGGITFSINTTGKKQTNSSLMASFPANELKPRSIIIRNSSITKDSLQNKALADSLRDNYNKQIYTKYKAIAVKGAANIPDGLLSVYNDEGFKAAALFNDKLEYTFELAVPLKELALSRLQQQKLTYNIKLNSVAGGAVITSIGGRDDILGFEGADGVRYMIGRVSPENLTLAYDTDFWGEYTLAEKP